MSHEVWDGVLRPPHRADRASIETTLVFVNTRRMAERVARHSAERLGEDAVTAHHGSLSKEKRLDAETRLKSGQLKALVATASLELGIDIGHVDLVCQIGSPHRIATFLQRVGRSGHTRRGTAEGPAVPGLARRPRRVRGAAARGPPRRARSHRRRTTRRSTCSRSRSSPRPRASDYAEDELYALVRRAWPYRDLTRDDFDAVVKMIADGFATQRGRRGALRASRRSERARARPPRRAHARASPPAARSPRSPTTAWCSSPRTRSSARSTKTSPSRATPATSSSSATRRGRSCRSAPASCASPTRKGAPPTHPVLARRSAGAERRAVARGERSARGLDRRLRSTTRAGRR